VARRASDLAEGLELARRSLASGAAHSVFDRLRRPTELEFA
jgi:anthranilate phosphoribosyltransferase